MSAQQQQQQQQQGHNMSQTDANSMGGESSRGGHVGHTGTGCYKNHEHSMGLHGTGTAGTAGMANRSAHQRRPSAVATATGAVSIAAVTALLASSPATNVSGHPAHVQQQANNLVDLGDSPCSRKRLLSFSDQQHQKVAQPASPTLSRRADNNRSGGSSSALAASSAFHTPDLNEFVESERALRKFQPYSSCCSSAVMAAGPATLIEMQPMGLSSNQASGQHHHPSTSSNRSSPARSASVQQRRTRPTDLASFDSSDTWASCNPFPSITDLAGWSPQGGAQTDQQLFVKPLPEERYATVDETSRLLYQQFNEVGQSDDSSVLGKPIKPAKPRPRFKEAPSSEEEPMTPVSGSKKEQQAGSKSGGGPGLASSGSLNKKFRKSSQGGGKPSFLTGRGIASATRFLNYRFLSLQSTDNRGRGSPDRKKSILKRSSEGSGGGGGGGSTSVGSTSAGHLSDQDPEMEKLIGEGATASESGSEPFSPLVVQRRIAGNKASRGRPDGQSQLHPGPDTMDTSCALEDWPFADYSPTEEANDGRTSNT